MPINTGNAAEGLLALKDGKFVTLRVPYPLGFYTKWMDGRIDDPNAGWKGRGVWTTISTRTPFHMETGRGHDEQGDEVPDAAGPAGEVAARRTRKARPGAPGRAFVRVLGRHFASRRGVWPCAAL